MIVDAQAYGPVSPHLKPGQAMDVHGQADDAWPSCAIDWYFFYYVYVVVDKWRKLVMEVAKGHSCNLV